MSTYPRPADLTGLITADAGDVLADLASVVDVEHAVVEVGSYKGKSTAFLAHGAKHGNGAHVFAVDAWDTPGNVTGRFGFAEPSTRETFEAQLRSARLWSKVTALHGFSVDVARAWGGQPIGLLFVDGDHEAPSVAADFTAWERHLAPSAVVVFDDYGTPRNPGVAQVVDALVACGTLTSMGLHADRLAVTRYAGATA